MALFNSPRPEIQGRRLIPSGERWRRPGAGAQNQRSRHLAPLDGQNARVCETPGKSSRLNLIFPLFEVFVIRL